MKLLTLANAKVLKGQVMGYLTAIMHLAPYTLSGYNVCPMASKGCAAACLNTTGNGNYPATQAARIRKTKMFFEARADFMALLVSDIRVLIKKANKMGLLPAVRLNGTSDIRFETVPVTIDGVEYRNLMEAFPALMFYDYTAIPNRQDLPANYHLTFSRKESNGKDVAAMIGQGMNVAVVFGVKKDCPLPKMWGARKVIDGDTTDLRFTDAKGIIVGLRGKGKARGKNTHGGFVVTV